ncbi:MAG: trigger factor [Thermodesulfobacteriota bacterium]
MGNHWGFESPLSHHKNLKKLREGDMEKQEKKIEYTAVLEDVSPVNKKVKISVSPDDVKEAIELAYQRAGATAAIPGFRKGTIPRSVLKAKFADAINGDIATRLIDNTYHKALEDVALTPLDGPHVDIETLNPEEGRPFIYTLTFEVTPKVEVGNYKGLDIGEVLEVTVTDEDIEKSIDGIKETNIRFKEVDKAAEDKDMVIIDFTSSKKGKPVKGLKGNAYPVLIGETSPMPGLDEALKGLKKGDKKDVDLTFPDNYSEKKLAGKDVVFHVEVQAVKEKTLPVIDDEFARGLQCDDLEGLKARVAGEIKKAKEKQEKDRLKTVILDQLIADLELDVPDSLSEKYLDLIFKSVVDNMRAGMVHPEDKGLSQEALREKYRPLSVRRAREDMILDAIALKEKMEISNEEVEASVKELAVERNLPVDSLLTRIQREGNLEMIKDGLKHEKVFDLIIESAKKA